MMKRIIASLTSALSRTKGRERLSLLLLALAVTATASAQGVFLDQLRKIETGKGVVIVQQDPAIDKLVNNVQAKPAQTSTDKTTQTTAGKTNQAIAGASSASAAATSPAHKQETPKPETKPESSSAKQNAGSTKVEETPEQDASLSVDTRKKVMLHSYKTTGYRIQIFSGGNSRTDRQKAEKAGNAMKAHFPSEPIYVHFYSPSWKCRMGNYKELEEARRILAQVKALGYTQACIVKGTISVQY